MLASDNCNFGDVSQERKFMDRERNYTKNLTPLAVWAFSIGTSVGWGSLVVTARTYLAQAGPLGTAFGLIAGALIMFLICRSYAYMMKNYPENGGAYAYAREVFGYDMGFIAAWFITITYLAMLWANATSLPLFGRIFLGGIFEFGKMYTIFDYDIYFGEVLLSVAALVFFGFLCSRNKSLINRIMIALALLFTGAIVITFAASMIGGHSRIAMPYLPGTSELSQIAKIAVISPWAFIGFESISHQTEEFRFEHTRSHRILLWAVVSTVALYIFITIASVTAYPSQYSGWLEYIQDLDNLRGIEALPTFYAAYTYLGNTGYYLLMAALLALVISSLIGNITSLSRMICAMGRDKVLPDSFGQLNKYSVPEKAIWSVVVMSCVMPFVGRTAIGWIVDVTTIGAVMLYSLVSACAFKMAKDMGDTTEKYTGLAGVVVMVAVGAWFLIPNLVTKGSMATETYLLFIVWSVLGFLFFRYILRRDNKKRFGASVSVWVVLLALVLLVSLIWMRQSMIQSYDTTLAQVQEHYRAIGGGDAARAADELYITELMDKLEISNTRTMLIAVAMFGFALAVMLTNHSYMNRRQKESEMLANKDPMTGVMSKHAWLVKEKEIDGEIQAGEIKDFAVVVCDVNGLKKINDTYGHKAGDEYIRKACALVCDIFQHSPVFRVGGDEFVALLTGRDYAVRHELMNALHERSAENIRLNEAVVSGGLSDFKPGTDSILHQVFERADSEMYKEKKLLKSLGAVTRDEEPEPLYLPETEPAEEIIAVRRKILIAEDEPINQELLATILEEDYEIMLASDGEEALKVMREHKDEIAIVLLDLQMPKKNGIEVMEVMNRDASLSRIPVIVLTADQNAELQCLKLGAMDFIPKPYPIWEVVRARVDKCIELSEDRETIQSTERDNLTKLFNISYFQNYVRKYDQHYFDMPMDAVVVDINHFHMINERYGKMYGDTVLRRIGEKIRRLCREINGVGCRQGADTFLIYCPHRDDYDGFLKQIMSALNHEETSTNRIRLRLGVYHNADKTLDIERRYDRAKIASDSVKTGRASMIGIYDEKMGESALYHERLLEDFRASIDNRDFLVVFQPKFDIRPETPMLSSAEALVRWKHPELGMISPGVFIPLLEENGLITELDKYVWREAAATIRKWKDSFGYSVPVSVNVSRIDMLIPNLNAVFQEILDEYQLDNNDIILEITESAYTGESDQVISTARELRNMGLGFRIEMDDFGTGYSSLGLLSNLPIDALKLDMSFVRSAFGETRDTRMIELIIDIADYLHVPVVAEGVETEEQYLVLKALGCDMIQGYYFSKPVPQEEFNHFLEERKSQSAEVTPVMRRTAMSISRALTGDFEDIYYVDIVTDCYLKFTKSGDGNLGISPGGMDFFDTAANELISKAAESDRKKLADVLQKTTLMKLVNSGQEVTVPFNMMKDGAAVPYSLQTIKTRASDTHHVVIGVQPQN